jgi:hypothetical protein
MDPESQLAMPARHVIMLDFPAPFGPSKPVIPGPKVNETSLTATRAPYRRVKCETVSSAPAADAAVPGAAVASVVVIMMNAVSSYLARAGA